MSRTCMLQHCRAVLCASLVLAFTGGAGAQEQPCTPLLEAISQPEHTVFAKIFEAAEVPLEASKPYTVFVPEDGTADPPEDQGTTGESGILGLFTSYGVNVSTTESIAASPIFSQIRGFMGYYVVLGAYSLEELRTRSAPNHLVTLYNTSSDTCSNPGEQGSESLADGDLKVGSEGGEVVITDDSSTTIQATVSTGDIPACGGSVVHLIQGVLNPCCSSAAADCTSASLDPKQIELQTGGYGHW